MYRLCSFLHVTLSNFHVHYLPATYSNCLLQRLALRGYSWVYLVTCLHWKCQDLLSLFNTI